MRDINTIAIIGAGTMGHEIAQVALMGGFKSVVLNDVKPKILEKAVNKIENGLKKLEVKKKLKEGYTASILMKNLRTEIDLKKTVSHADFVFEAIPEIMKLKQDLFLKLGKFAPEYTILATNTSTMSITEIATFSGRSDRVIGCHFFTPIVVLRLIEIIKGKETSEKTVEITKKVCQQLPALRGKRFLPVIERESPGFIVNRLTIASGLYLNWLLDYAYQNGIPLEEIDADTTDLMQLGPYAKWDYLGLDVICNVMKYFEKVVSLDFTPSKILINLVNEGKLGRKTGEGLFKWIEGKPDVSPEKKAGLFNPEIFMAIQLNEGCKLLEEGIVSDYKIIDEAMLTGMIMPGPFSAGKRNWEKWTKL
ncbi:MAG: 3-hydroxyacyl-CoA dehydrogenase family protein, partial [Promethearchaeota archaeon]